MAVELCQLIQKVKYKDITLVAGERGISNGVSWVHMVETVIASDFLSGGELVIITGAGLKPEETVDDLVKCLYAHKAAGVIINTGPYIEQLSSELLEFCDLHAFPVFVVPWRVQLVEIIRTICRHITKEEQRKQETAAAFKNAIHFPKQEEIYVIPLSQRNFQSNWCYSACSMKLSHITGNENDRMESLCMSLENAVRSFKFDIALFWDNSEIILICANMEEAELLSFVMDVYARAKALLLPGEQITLGLGRLTKSVRCLYKSYYQAKAIQRLQAEGNISADKFYYGHLGVYRLLIGIEDKDIVQGYLDSVLKPLWDYDRMNKTDLCNVLKCYLDHDGSVNQTADALYVHRNTVNYKINRIAAVLNVDLSSLKIRMELMLAFSLQTLCNPDIPKSETE